MDNQQPWLLDCLQRLERQYPRAFQVSKILSCGGMVGAAFLYAISEHEGHQYCALVLSIYLMSSLIFCFVHLEGIYLYGQYIVPAGLFILVFAVLSSKSSKRELAPWLPLFFTTLAVIMAALPGVSNLVNHPEAGSSRSLGSSSSMDIIHMGPSSRRSQYSHSPPSTSAGSAFTLSDIIPQPRDSWGLDIRGFFWPGTTALPNHQEHRDTDTASLQGLYLPDSSRISQDYSAHSDAPLIDGMRP